MGRRLVAWTITLFVLSGLVATLVSLDPKGGGAASVRLTTPSSTFVHVRGDPLIIRGVLEGNCSIASEGIRRWLKPGGFSRSVRLPPDQLGERLLWVNAVCDDASTTRFARSGTVILPGGFDATENHEVARVGVDLQRLERWLESFVGETLYDNVNERYLFDGNYQGGKKKCPRLPRRNEDDYLPSVPSRKCGLKQRIARYDFYFRVIGVGRPNLTLDVDDGIAVDIEVPIRLFVRETNCAGECQEDQRPNVKLRWRGTVSISRTGYEQRPLAFRISTEYRNIEFDRGLGFWLPRSGINAMLDLFPGWVLNKTEIEDEAGGALSGLVNGIIQHLRSKTPEELVRFLATSETAARLARAVDAPRGMDIANVRVRGEGERLYASLSVPGQWLGVTTPELSAGGGGSIRLLVSYALINRVLATVLDGRALRDILSEAKSILLLAGVADAAQLDSMVNTIVGGFDDWHTFLEYAELELDDELSFDIPLRLRPVDENESRVFAANMNVLSTPQDQAEQTTIGLSAEGRISLDRLMGAPDVDFLLDHVAFEPSAAEGVAVNAPAVGRYFGLTPLYDRIRGWERRGELVGEDLGEGIADFRSMLVRLFEAFSLREYLPLELELGGGGDRTIVATLLDITNRVQQNALMLEGNIGFSRAAALYVSVDRSYWYVVRNRASGAQAAREAKRSCEREFARRGGMGGCFEVRRFYRIAAAIAQGAEEGSERHYFGFGESRTGAQRIAMQRCEKAGATNCKIDRVWTNGG